MEIGPQKAAPCYGFGGPISYNGSIYMAPLFRVCRGSDSTMVVCMAPLGFFGFELEL